MSDAQEGDVATSIKDVARAAGVSTATVSRALRGLANVDPATRARVARVAAELDYVISPSASRLASGRTGSVAVVTPDIARWFFSTVLSGIEAVFQQAAMDVLLLGCSETDGSMLSARLRRRVDAVIVVGLPLGDPRLQEILALELPTSIVGTSLPGVASAVIDDVVAGRTATQHLINLGHERIGIISGEPDHAPDTVGYDRLQGYREAMAQAGLAVDPHLEAYGSFTITGGEQAMTVLLTQPTPPTAVFAMSDEMAFGAMKALRHHGLHPGADVSLIGVDGHDMADYLELTTVEQPAVELGRLAAEAVLVQLASGEPGEAVQLPTHLVVRRSTGPRRSAERPE